MYAIETCGLGKQYGKLWALAECSFALEPGRIAGLVGPNGAGKTTLMHLLVGLLAPTAGAAFIFGRSPQRETAEVLAKVGFVSQDRPLYRSFTVTDMLTLGRKLNRHWDDALARSRLQQLEIPLDRRIGKLSGGQQAQVALLLALAKRPDLLILDEPVGSLDPLARHQFLQILMDSVAEHGQTVLISSHQVADLERVCDALLLLSHARLLLAGDLERLLRGHRWITAPEGQDWRAPGAVIATAPLGRARRMLVRLNGARTGGHGAGSDLGEPVTLDELILAYLALKPDESAALTAHQEVAA